MTDEEDEPRKCPHCPHRIEAGDFAFTAWVGTGSDARQVHGHQRIRHGYEVVLFLWYPEWDSAAPADKLAVGSELTIEGTAYTVTAIQPTTPVLDGLVTVYGVPKDSGG
jgi:hypothetical protein